MTRDLPLRVVEGDATVGVVDRAAVLAAMMEERELMASVRDAADRELDGRGGAERAGVADRTAAEPVAPAR